MIERVKNGSSFTLNELLHQNGYFKKIREIKKITLKKDKIQYFKIVKKFIFDVINERHHDPFHFYCQDLTECDLGYFEPTLKKIHKEKQEIIQKYHNYIHWFVKKNNLNKKLFLSVIECFRFYTYSVIHNKLLNNPIMKKRVIDGKIKNLLSNYKYIDLDDFIDNPEPELTLENSSKRLQDSLGNYILPRIDEKYDINSHYNLSYLFYKNKKRI
jgi:hypothetical protein